MAETTSHFFKVILPSSLKDKKLEIPEMFVRKFGDELSAVATLTVPNGRAWKVGLIKDGQKIWLQEGWQDFVEYHSICAGYFLVFKYIKNSDFNVLIFDMSACEVNYACNGKDASNEKKNSIHQDEVAIKDCPNPNPFFIPSRSKVLHGCTSRRPYREMHTLSRENQEKQIEDMQRKRHKMEEMVVMSESREPKLNLTTKYNSRRSMHHKRQQSKSLEYFEPCQVDKDMDKTGRTKFEKPKHNGEDEHQTVVSEHKVEIKNNSNGVGRHSSEGDNKKSKIEEKEFFAILEDMGIYFTRKYGYITAEERERAMSVARLLKPKNPSFMVIWRPSNLCNSRVYVPLKFSTRYLRDVNKRVKLQYSDGTESVAEMTWYNDICYISKGWTRTTCGKYFKTGDICNFELVSMKDVLFRVFAFSAPIE